MVEERTEDPGGKVDVVAAAGHGDDIGRDGNKKRAWRSRWYVRKPLTDGAIDQADLE